MDSSASSIVTSRSPRHGGRASAGDGFPQCVFIAQPKVTGKLLLSREGAGRCEIAWRTPALLRQWDGGLCPQHRVVCFTRARLTGSRCRLLHRSARRLLATQIVCRAGSHRLKQDA
ncbi:hypothetical protein MRX96_024164 [Rhipicephalus microplus]